MHLLSAGGAQTVTGSCHRLEIGNARVLIDCGLFQGSRQLERRNSKRFPFSPAELDAVLITHGHLDHVGRLPKLVREGFAGPIFATRPTRKIAEIILRDAARLQFEDYKRSLRKARRAGRENAVEPPLYADSDVDRALELFAPPVEFAKPVDVAPGLQATFNTAGHILGSAWIQFDSADSRIIVSGDLGNRESALQAPASTPPECDAVLVEATYANRTHRSREATRREFRTIIEKAVNLGGIVMIPSFSLERTQGVLIQLKDLMEDPQFAKIPIFLDSPMATKMTRLYQTAANEFRPEIAERLAQGEDPFEPDTLSYTVKTEASIALNKIRGSAIFIAGSGMMSGGRIVHHLKHNLWKPESSLVVVGYQAKGSLGRRLVDGAKTVRIFGEEIVVRASIHTIGGFSAHADRDDILAWLSSVGGAQIHLVHGEDESINTFATFLRNSGHNVAIPQYGKRLPLGN
jgi:metallo-beta-lactamase family protein